MNFKRLAFCYLRFLARFALQGQRPFLVGITGTAGKTTACAVTERCLEAAFPGRVAHTGRHYNGEWGLPLSILGVRTPGRNPFAWLTLACVALYRRFHMPHYLVLEYGIDRPGEMADLLSVARPDVGLLLGVSPNHLMNFPSYQAYFNEKAALLPGSRRSALCAHDSQLAGLSAEIRYGFVDDAGATLTAQDIRATPEGLEFRIVHGSESAGPVRVKFFGSYNVLPLLAGVAAARLAGVSLVVATKALEGLEPEEGRGTLLKGKGGSVIVDGSYNGGFASITAGLASVQETGQGFSPVLILGDMRELGDETARLHEALVPEIIKTAPQVVVLVGPLMARYVVPSLERALPGRVRHFLSSRQAGKWVTENLLEKSPEKRIIFIKGSQNTIFLEEAVSQMLQDPADIVRLCRGGREWARCKDIFFSSLI